MRERERESASESAREREVGEGNGGCIGVGYNKTMKHDPHHPSPPAPLQSSDRVECGRVPPAIHCDFSNLIVGKLAPRGCISLTGEWKRKGALRQSNECERGPGSSERLHGKLFQPPHVPSVKNSRCARGPHQHFTSSIIGLHLKKHLY